MGTRLGQSLAAHKYWSLWGSEKKDQTVSNELISSKGRNLELWMSWPVGLGPHGMLLMGKTWSNFRVLSWSTVMGDLTCGHGDRPYENTIASYQYDIYQHDHLIEKSPFAFLFHKL